MTQRDPIKEFSGTQDDDIQPTEFLKMVNRYLMTQSTVPPDDLRVATVGYWLKTDSPAEEWYNEPTTQPSKTKYVDFENAFKA